MYCLIIRLRGYRTSLKRSFNAVRSKHRIYRKKFNIPEAELDFLVLFGDERYLTTKSIAQKLDVVKSRVTKITTGLIRKGLVESIEDPKDARVKLIGLTQKGQKKSKEVNAIITDLHRKLLLELDPKQRKMVLSYLEALRLGMEVVKK